jgi:hypothetical protein
MPAVCRTHGRPVLYSAYLHRLPLVSFAGLVVRRRDRDDEPSSVTWASEELWI